MSGTRKLNKNLELTMSTNGNVPLPKADYFLTLHIKRKCVLVLQNQLSYENVIMKIFKR